MGLFSRVRQRHPSVAPAPVLPETELPSKKRGRPRGGRNGSPKPMQVRHKVIWDIDQADHPEVSPATWNFLVSLTRSLFLGLLRIVGHLKVEAPGAEQERVLFKDIPVLFHKLIRELAEWWWTHQDRGFLGTTLTCPYCKNDCLAYKGDAEREVVTIFGIISPRRAYYYCKGCKRGLSPLDERLGLLEDSFLPTVREVVTWLTSMDPYGKCLEFVARLLTFSISPRSAWLITQRVAADVKSRCDEELAKAFGDPADICLPEPEVAAPEVGVVSLDGVMARIGKPDKKEKAQISDPTRPCNHADGLGEEEAEAKPGFKEVKLALAGHLIPAKKNSANKDERPSIGIRKYAVHLGQPQALFQMLLLLVYRLGLHQAKTLLVIADGAHWIWAGVKEHFASLGIQVVEILDYWHAVEHLWALSRALYGQGTQAASVWVATQKRHLLQGRQLEFFAALEQAVVQAGPIIRTTWPGKVTLKVGLKPLPRGAGCEALRRCELLSSSWPSRSFSTRVPNRRKGSQKTVERSQKNPTLFELAQETLTYFRNNRSRINYHEYLAKGYLIGSGAMEGACKHLVKERAHRSGMRWGPDGCMAILRNRALIKSGDWDAFWAEQANRRQSDYTRLKNLLGAA